jgi:hypothetical protein
VVHFAALSFVLFMGSIAHAGSNVSATVSVTLTGIGGAEYGYGSNYADGQYVMPYYLSIHNGAPIAVICDDYNHDVTAGEQWTGTIHTLNDLTGTRFGTAFTTQYHEAAWIASQISSTSPLVTLAAAQFAIWKLFSSNTPMVVGEAAWLSAATTAAQNNYYGIDFSQWRIVTPASSASPQEYFFDLMPIPEPSALLDLLVGLPMFLGFWTMKHRRLLTASDRTQRIHRS